MMGCARGQAQPAAFSEVAIVVAEDVVTARKAAEAVQVEYRVHPGLAQATAIDVDRLTCHIA